MYQTDFSIDCQDLGNEKSDILITQGSGKVEVKVVALFYFFAYWSDSCCR